MRFASLFLIRLVKKPRTFTTRFIHSNMANLAAIRTVLKEGNIDAFIVGTGDAHQSEYVAECDMRRQFASGFSGSAGTAVILQDKALLWTDGRYFLQAEKELSPDWTLMRMGDVGVPDIKDWLLRNMKAGETVGVDPVFTPAREAKIYEAALNAKGIKYVGVGNNPIDQVWKSVGKPATPQGIANVHDVTKAGEHSSSKIEKIQAYLETNNAVGVTVTMLDEIAWLFNIRGTDVQYNPVVFSYAVVTRDGAFLFIDAQKVTPALREHLGSSVTILPYEAVEGFIAELAGKGSIIMDPTQINYRLYSAAPKERIIEKPSPIALPKSIKNAVELEGIRNSHIRDGAALTAFLHWLELTVKGAPGSLSECDAAAKLEEFRGRMKDHMGPSFTTIAGYGANGAVIHYSPKPETAAKIGVDSMFLLDSGAQYLDGTTDVTRTMHFGTPTQRMKDCYTLVLKGHIALASIVFPEATLGSRLDVVARSALWQHGLEYNHGTGHGVGAFLNVHEGPQGIGSRQRENEAGFAAGMTISNEPGYYENGSFGIRIENICVSVEKKTPNNFGGKRFLGLDTVTMVPIKKNLINVQLLNDNEIKWLNDYHATVRTVLAPLMEQYFPESVSFLIEETSSL